jgi:hypothetical protein
MEEFNPIIFNLLTYLYLFPFIPLLVSIFPTLYLLPFAYFPSLLSSELKFCFGVVFIFTTSFESCYFGKDMHSL